MSNMSYCRFRNTLNDLDDCVDNMDTRLDELGDDEKRARLIMIKIFNLSMTAFKHYFAYESWHVKCI